VAAKLANPFAAGDVPEPAHHIVGDRGELGAVGRDRELAKLACVRVNGADDAVVFEVPPDQAIVVAAGD
jgi:hypothetical protein